jgi:hypothetical protein
MTRLFGHQAHGVFRRSSTTTRHPSATEVRKRSAAKQTTALSANVHWSIWFALLAGSMLVAGYAAVANIKSSSEACRSDTSPVATGTYEVDVSEATCGADGAVNIISVALKDGKGKIPPTVLFSYEPNVDMESSDADSDPPDVRWLSPNQLEISVAEVARVQTRVTSVNGVRISYRIGKVTGVNHQWAAG